VRWCSDLNQRRGGGLPETALHGGARRAEALDGGRPNEGRGTPLSRSMRSSRVWRWSRRCWWPGWRVGEGHHRWSTQRLGARQGRLFPAPTEGGDARVRGATVVVVAMGSGVDVPREGGGDARTGDWVGREVSRGGQRAQEWLARAYTGKGGGVAGGHTMRKGGPSGRQRRGNGGRGNGLRPVEQGRYYAWATMASGAGRCGPLVWAVPEKNSNISIYPKYSNGLESIKSKDRVPMLEKIK
jgi:hypothetical protein